MLSSSTLKGHIFAHVAEDGSFRVGADVQPNIAMVLTDAAGFPLETNPAEAFGKFNFGKEVGAAEEHM